jgi:MATE family multidrug resistance protein
MGMSVIIGLNSALDTLVSNAAGSGNVEYCGVYLNRARYIVTLAFIPMIIVAYYIRDILLSLGQDPVVSVYAA